ncbi:MAG: hypothetical protein ACXW6T_27665 [Candidatus Binatia bacterium]
MAGKSPVAASAEQKAALRTLAGSRDRGDLPERVNDFETAQCLI